MSWKPSHPPIEKKKSIPNVLLVNLADQCYGIDLSLVERVLWRVALTPLPDSPDWLAGILNYQARLMGVIHGRRRLGLPDRPPLLTDRLVLLRSADFRFGLLVDTTLEVRTFSADQADQAVSLEQTTPLLHSAFEIDGEVVLILGATQLATEMAAVLRTHSLSLAL